MVSYNFTPKKRKTKEWQGEYLQKHVIKKKIRKKKLKNIEK